MAERYGSLSPNEIVSGNLSADQSMAGRLSSEQAMSGTLAPLKVYGTYTGVTTVTPTPYTQTLSTSGLIVTHDITVNPIPSNYGLITWDGSVLTVS